MEFYIEIYLGKDNYKKKWKYISPEYTFPTHNVHICRSRRWGPRGILMDVWILSPRFL